MLDVMDLGALDTAAAGRDSIDLMPTAPAGPAEPLDPDPGARPSAHLDAASPQPPRTNLAALRRLLTAGIMILALGALTVTALDLSGAGDPEALLHLTISQVGLTPLAPIFESAVLAIAVGGALILAVAASLRRAHRGQAACGAALGALAVTGFVLVAAFTKQDWSQPPALSGSIHRIGSLAAFLALPLAVIVLARRARQAGRLAAGATVAALAGLASFLPIVIAIASVGIRGGWYRQVPLGLVERAIALGDILALFLLAAMCARELKPALRVHI